MLVCDVSRVFYGDILASEIRFHLCPIDKNTFCELSNKERRLLNISGKNKKNIDKIAPFFNNFIVYD